MEQLTNLLLVVVVIGYLFHYVYKKMNKESVVSKIDNRTYEVRKLPDSQDAADKLAIISQKLTDLVDHVYKHDRDRDGVHQLKEKFNSRNITENAPGGRYTAYSVNKGEELSICLRNATDNKFINNNLIIFVSIHELAHVMTDEVGHTEKFWDNMKYLLEQGQQIGVYTPEDYDKNPQMYCGQEINSTPYKFN